MPHTATAEGLNSTREQMINLLNQDLAKGYQTVIAYTKCGEALQGTDQVNLARELEQHAAAELQHALTLAKQIDILSAMPGKIAPGQTQHGPTTQ